jgi:hypothetical protein
MEWTWLIMGVVIGSLVTSVLIWIQRGTIPGDARPGYFSRVALSVVITAVLAGLVRLGIDAMSTGGLSLKCIWFGSGWMFGGLIAGWFVSNALQRR